MPRRLGTYHNTHKVLSSLHDEQRLHSCVSNPLEEEEVRKDIW